MKPLAIGVALVVLAACDASQKDWEAARSSNTRDAYVQFLKAHPEGERAALARNAMAQLDRDANLAAAAEARNRKASAALEAALRHETIPALVRVERAHGGTPAAEEAGRAVARLKAARRDEVRSVERVAITLDAPSALAAVPAAKAAAEILALAGVESGGAETTDATLRIQLRASTEGGSYSRTGLSRGDSVERVTGAAVAGEHRFEVRGGAKFARSFRGRVPRSEIVMGTQPEAPPYFEAAGLDHTDDPQRSYSHRYDDVVDPPSTMSVRLVELMAELFGPSVRRAALIETSRFRWAVLRATTPRNDPRTVDLLVELLPTAGMDRSHVVGALGRSGDGRAVPHLLPLLAEGHSRLPVVDALGRLGDRRAALPLVGVLEGLAKEKLDYQRDYIVGALKRIAGRSFGTDVAWRRWAETAASQ